MSLGLTPEFIPFHYLFEPVSQYACMTVPTESLPDIPIDTGPTVVTDYAVSSRAVV